MNCTATHTRHLGLVAKNRREISPGNFYDKYFPAATHSDPILNKDGSVEDTVLLCQQIVNKTLADTKEIAALLKRATLRETAEAIFSFLYRHYQYKEDKPGVEQLRRPARAWHDRKSGVDCDCFAITISSILTNQGTPHSLRIVKMYGRDYYQHIYVVIPKEKGADLSRRSNYIVIDPVLDHFDYEAPGITLKKDYDMNGIPIQYLNGLGCAGGPQRTNGLMGFGNEFEGLGIVIYIPDVTQPRMMRPHREQNSVDVYRDFMRRKKRHLINTRNVIARHPHTVANCYKPRVLLGMIDELIGVWDNDQQREHTLDRLSNIEHEAIVGGMNGLGALGGFFDKLKKLGNKIKEGVKKGAKWVGDTAKKIGKVILKYNPLSIAARAGFRAAMHLNFGYLASKAYWGYFSEAEAKAKRVSSSYWRKAGELKGKMEHVFVDILKGDSDNLKNDILKGGSKRSAGGNLNGTQGLGIALAASMTAAMAFLVPLINAAKSIFGKGGDEGEAAPTDNGPGGAADSSNNSGNPLPDSNAPGADNFADNSGGANNRSGSNGNGGNNNDTTDTSGSDANSGGSGGGITSLLKNKKNLLLYAALAAGGLLLLKMANNNPPQAAPYMPAPQPLPAPQPAPAPQYAPTMAGVKRKRKKAPEQKTTKKAVKTILLS